MESVFTVPTKATLAKYHVTAGQTKALVLTIAIPYIVIWFIALIGYMRLKAYTAPLKKTKDGAAIGLIASGIFLLTLWLPASTLLSALFTHIYTQHPAATASLVRVNNYFDVVLLLVAFWIINRGSNRLLTLIKKRPAISYQILTLGYIAFAALYTLIVLHDSARAVPTKDVQTAAYYQPDWLIVLTLLIPRLIMWFLGLQAVTNIYIYQQQVNGSLYKVALMDLARGVGGVVLAIIVLRCLQSLSSTLTGLSLGALFGVVYLLLIIISVGYVFIARGAKNLQKLEEI